jgi:hypothetical protein
MFQKKRGEQVIAMKIRSRFPCAFKSTKKLPLRFTTIFTTKANYTKVQVDSSKQNA